MEFSIKIILDNIYQKLSFKKAGRVGEEEIEVVLNIT